MSETAQKTSGKETRTAKPHRVPARNAMPAAYGPSPDVGALGTLHAWAGDRAVTDLLGRGSPLAPDIRTQMESSFGADFSNVRIHDHPGAHASAAAMGANAFSSGTNIVFAGDRFATHTL